MRRVHPRKLLVEGDTDKRVMPFLLEANGVVWEAAGQPVVHIESCDGVEEMLKPGAIEGELAASGLEALGAVVDANGDAHRQWDRIRHRCREHFSSLPAAIPLEGLQVAAGTGPRFGVWIMPDNRSSGMLEDFLVQLVPSEARHLFSFARQCVEEAAQRGGLRPSIHWKGCGCSRCRIALLRRRRTWADSQGRSQPQLA